LSTTRKKIIKSALPVYIAAGAFVVCGVILPMYRLWAVLAGLAVAAAGYLISDRLIPKKEIEVPVEPEKVKTGDATADELIAQGQEAVKKLRQLNDEIKDTLLTAQINRMEIACDSIFKSIAEKPSRAGQARRFMNYYLPTSLKLLESYKKLTDITTGLQNVESTRVRIRESMGMIADAFEKQLDSLYEDEALDISTDIEVMESMLKGEGLK